MGWYSWPASLAYNTQRQTLEQRPQEGRGTCVLSPALRAETVNIWGQMQEGTRTSPTPQSPTFLTLSESLRNQDKRPDTSQVRAGLSPPQSTGRAGEHPDLWLFPHLLGTPTPRGVGEAGAAAGRRWAREQWRKVSSLPSTPAPSPRTMQRVGLRCPGSHPVLKWEAGATSPQVRKLGSGENGPEGQGGNRASRRPH